jgi:hypothetical protein
MSAFKGYVVTAPDGKTYDVNAPEGTNQEDLYRYVQQTYYGDGVTQENSQVVEPATQPQMETIAVQGSPFDFMKEAPAPSRMSPEKEAGQNCSVCCAECLD